MSKVNVTELRQNLSAYLARVQGGEPVEVTVRGRVIARIVAESDGVEAARKRLKAARRNARVGDVISPTGVRWNAERGRC